MEPSLASFFGGVAEEIESAPRSVRRRRLGGAAPPLREDQAAAEASLRRLRLAAPRHEIAWELLDVEEFSSDDGGDGESLRALCKRAHVAARSARPPPVVPKEVAAVAAALERLSVVAVNDGPRTTTHACAGCGYVFSLRKTLALHTRSCAKR
jgi:hypothetical protein